MSLKLARVTSSPLVHGALVFDREGRLLAATPGSDTRALRCVVLAALVGVADTVFGSTGVRHVIAQDGERRLVVVPIGEGSLLAAVVSGEAELGSALPLVERAAAALS